jgi:adenine deaminase
MFDYLLIFRTEILNMIVRGHIVDILNHRIFPGKVTFESERIVSIEERPSAPDVFIMPGFIDAHVHIESSMMVPAEFARMAVVHGTVATVSDPHEIGNVLGIEGVRYMIENGRQTPFKFYFGAPSCVPATSFETAGAEITAKEIEELFVKDNLKYLAEMMNWPGVLFKDRIVAEKIAIAKRCGKVIDGHAPGLRGSQAKSYAEAGMSTDHECFTAEEALDKLRFGMKILIREGSAAKNFDALIELTHEHFDRIMLCSDDKHPDSLEEGHINQLAKRAVAHGIDLFKVLQAACINPIDHYKLEVGKLHLGDYADFVVVNDLKSFEVLRTFINGRLVAENGKTLIDRVNSKIINNFKAQRVKTSDFEIVRRGDKLRVIEALDGQLITNEVVHNIGYNSNIVSSDVENDVLKIAVVNRYVAARPAVAFIKNFGLKKGAVASSVGHDSHNIVAVGVDDESIAEAVNLIIESRGGVSAVNKSSKMILPLPVAGIMSSDDGYRIAEHYKAIDRMAKDLGCKLASPFMTLSFMALLVIPSLKLSDHGLFDGSQFKFVDLFVE